jgi:hypothetical protein
VDASSSLLLKAFYPAWLVLKYLVLVPLDKIFFDGLGVLWRSKEELREHIVKNGIVISDDCGSFEFDKSIDEFFDEESFFGDTSLRIDTDPTDPCYRRWSFFINHGLLSFKYVVLASLAKVFCFRHVHR